MHARAVGCNYTSSYCVKKLVEHVLTTFKNFPVETLSDMWRTKTRVLKAIVTCDGGNDYAIPRSNTD